jgi:hypothetical protein
MGKIIGGILGTLAIAGLVLFLLFHFGVLSFGKGDGNGDVKTETVTDMRSEAIDEVEEITVTIVVKQDKYVIEEQEVTLTQIKEKVTDKSAIIKVILEDNYASAKAWDDIKTSLTDWGIVPIEQ